MPTPISLPAGLTLTSPWFDVSHPLPSVHTNARYDIVAPPSLDLTIPHPNFPADEIWPSKPPRMETYCEANTVTHPLVSPLATRKEDWRGACPVFVGVGWEGMMDEGEVFGRRVTMENLGGEGGKVVFDGWVGMPHCFR